MWQLQIEIEYYSIKYFENVTEFVALAASTKGGVHTHL